MIKLKIGLFFLSLVPLSSQALGPLTDLNNSNGGLVQKAHVFGKDERKDVDHSDKSVPWAAVGVLKNFRNTDKTGAFNPCTATLVGKDIAITSAHCVVDYSELKPIKGSFVKTDSGEQIQLHTVKYNEKKMLFQVGVNKSSVIDESEIENVVMGNIKTINPNGDMFTSDFMNDYAFLKLKKPLGEKVGWFAVKNLSVNKLLELKKITIVSYALTNGKYNRGKIQKDCNVQSREYEELFRHDCDVIRSTSGAPIFIFEKDKYKIVGLNSGQTDVGGKEYHKEYDEFANLYNFGVASVQFFYPLAEFGNFIVNK